MVITAILDASQTSANHLKIEIGAIDGTRHDDGAGLGSIETLTEYPIIHERPYPTAPKFLYHPAACCCLCISAHGSRLYTSRIQERGDRLRVFDRCREDESGPVLPDMCIVRFDDSLGALRILGNPRFHALGEMRGASCPSPDVVFSANNIET